MRMARGRRLTVSSLRVVPRVTDSTGEAAHEALTTCQALVPKEAWVLLCGELAWVHVHLPEGVEAESQAEPPGLLQD